YLLSKPPDAIPIFILGISISSVGIFFYLLLFSPERIKGYQLEYEAAPDLSTFKVVKRISGEPTNKEVDIPAIAYCSACGNQIHNPFRCQRCGQLLCGKHYLHGDHKCREEYQ
ncbi:MAG: AN1-type zinc finger protein, partial [Candidatus Hodarchaeales archaeon]